MKKEYSTLQQPVDDEGFAILRSSARTRFSVVDAHMKRVALKDAHPEHPTLTPYALHILYGDQKEKDHV